jgi:arginine decarboxylase
LLFDTTEVKGLDYLSTPTGIIGEAQELASEAFGADKSWFLVNGTTVGIHAAVMSVAEPLDTVLLSRDCHQSAFSALVLSGARPLWVQPAYDDEFGIATVSTENFKRRLSEAEEAGEAPSAALIVSPNYFGVCADVSEISKACHEQLDIPLLVDEAHGSHFAFDSKLPQTSLAAGADLVVQSTHKTLSAMTQASVLHVKGERINLDRVSASLQILQSSSPNYLLMSSIDAARAHASLASDYYDEEDSGTPQTFTRAIQQCMEFKREVASIPGLRVLGINGGDAPLAFWDQRRLDPLRVTVSVSELQQNGFEVSSTLEERYGIVSELATNKCMVFIVTLSTLRSDLEQLAVALREIAVKGRGGGTGLNSAESGAKATLLDLAFECTQVLSPRDAFFSKHCRVDIGKAVGRVCAEIVCPYPPGIPILYPGEEISENALAFLKTFKQDGGYVTGCSDTTLKTILVVEQQLQN